MERHVGLEYIIAAINHMAIRRRGDTRHRRRLGSGDATVTETVTDGDGGGCRAAASFHH